MFHFITDRILAIDATPGARAHARQRLPDLAKGPIRRPVSSGKPRLGTGYARSVVSCRVHLPLVFVQIGRGIRIKTGVGKMDHGGRYSEIAETLGSALRSLRRRFSSSAES